jgi:hypothetical protein
MFVLQSPIEKSRFLSSVLSHVAAVVGVVVKTVDKTTDSKKRLGNFILTLTHFLSNLSLKFKNPMVRLLIGTIKVRL